MKITRFPNYLAYTFYDAASKRDRDRERGLVSGYGRCRPAEADDVNCRCQPDGACQQARRIVRISTTAASFRKRSREQARSNACTAHDGQHTVNYRPAVVNVVKRTAAAGRTASVSTLRVATAERSHRQ